MSLNVDWRMLILILVDKSLQKFSQPSLNKIVFVYIKKIVDELYRYYFFHFFNFLSSPRRRGVTFPHCRESNQSG